MHLIAGTEKDQSLSELATSVQYQALRNVADTEYQRSEFNSSEDGLEASNFELGGGNYQAPIVYFDVAGIGGEDGLRAQMFLAKLEESRRLGFSIIDDSIALGIEGYEEVLIRGGEAIEEDGTFFEQALWSDEFKGDTFAPGLAGLVAGNLGNIAGGECVNPTGSVVIAAAASGRQPGISDSDTIQSEIGTSRLGSRLVDPNQDVAQQVGDDNVSPVLAAESEELVKTVTNAKLSLAEVYDIGLSQPIDQCFIVRASSTLEINTAFSPVKSLPNLEYHDFFFASKEESEAAAIALNDESANYFFTRDGNENNRITEEKRLELLTQAKKAKKKWGIY